MRQFALGNQKKVEEMYSPAGYKNLPWAEGDKAPDNAGPKYEYRTNPNTGKQERRRVN